MRKTTRLFGALSLLAVLGLTAAACGDDDSSSSDTGGAETTAGGTETTEGATTDSGAAGTSCEGKKVALMYDVTGRGDKSFNDAAAAGLDKAKAELGFDSTESTPTGDADRAQRLQLAIDDNSDLIISVGFLWGDTVTTASQAAPDTDFAIIDSVVEQPNVASLVFAEEQGSFLVGVAAAEKSTSGKVGFIGGVENDLIKKFEAGFTAGATAANPDIEVTAQYITQPPDFTGFNDAAKGKEIATSMYASGIDVIYAAAGASGLGVFQAAQEASASGSQVWAIGVDSDQYNLVEPALQPYVLTSMLKKVDVAVYDTIKAFCAGEFAPEITTFDLAADGVGYSTSGGFIDDITADIDGYAEQIKSGEIEVPTTPGG